MAKNQPNMGAWFLTLIGSLAYLYVVYKLWGMSGTWPALTSSLAALGVGLLFAVAVLTSVSLVLMTLASLKMNDKDMHMWSWKNTMWAAFSLVVLTVATAGMASTWTLVVVIGFVLASIGNGMSKM